MQEKAKLLEAIAEENDGDLTPGAVVETARNPRHPLHQCFDWDDKSAAAKQRLATARQLISSVQVVVEIDDVMISAISYVRDVRKGRHEQGYCTVDALGKRREDSRQTLMIELERLEGGIKRARAIAAGLGLGEFLEVALMDIIRAKIRVQRKKKAA